MMGIYKLEDILDYLQPTKYIEKDILKKGEYPVLTANKSYLLGYTNDSENLFRNVPCIIFDDFTCDIKIVREPFKVRSSALKILILKDDKFNIDYIFNLMISLKLNPSEHKRHWISEISQLNVSVDSVEDQNVKGEILRNNGRELENLNKSLILEQERKSVILNKIFKSKEFNNGNYMNIGSICKKIKSGGTPKTTKNQYYNGDIPFAKINDLTSQGKYTRTTMISLSEEGLKNSQAWIVPKKSILFSMYASVGFVSINEIKLATNQAILGMIPDEKVVLTEWLYYWFLFNRKMILKKVDLGVQGNLNLKVIKGVHLQIPKISNQKKINILIKIDKKMVVLQERIKIVEERKSAILALIFN